MPFVKWIAAFVLCLSIASAGFPAQARAACAMPGATHMQAMTDCHQSPGQKPAKGCCCEDLACAAKCSPPGGVSMDLPRGDGLMSGPAGPNRLAQSNDAPAASVSPYSQERPPRLLA